MNTTTPPAPGAPTSRPRRTLVGRLRRLEAVEEVRAPAEQIRSISPDHLSDTPAWLTRSLSL